MIKKILTSILISVIIYFSIASVLILTDSGSHLASNDEGLDFEELFFDYSALPELNNYMARDGSKLDYRYYPAVSSERVLILLHGSGWHSQYFLPLAKAISQQNLAHVYTPDLRGHGEDPQRRGDIDYIEQLEDDLADFIQIISSKHNDSTLIIGGHSSGGGLAVRYAGSQYGNDADAYLLLSPFLKYNAPTVRKNSGGWANPYNRRIAGLTMLNNIGIRWFNDLTVIEFNMAEEARNGTETLAYSHRLNTGYAPRNYKRDLARISQPLLVVAGSDDESFYADQFEPTISKYTSGEFKILDGLSHMGVVVNPTIIDEIGDWIGSLK